MIKKVIATGLATVMFGSMVVSCGAAEVADNTPESIIPPGIEVVAYDPLVDYMALMKQCAETGSDESMVLGAIYEAQRNLKIRNSGIGDAQETNAFTSLDGEQVLKNLGIIKDEVPETEPEPTYVKYYTDADVQMLAKVMFLEARGIKSKTELSCICWTILNRVDAGYANSIYKVVTAPNQFAYSGYAKTVSDYGIDLVALAEDVLERWNREKNGEEDVGRTLPKNYLWYAGDGRHNYFRDAYRGGHRWDYSLTSPYEN